MRSTKLIELRNAIDSMNKQLAKTSIAIYNMNEYIRLLSPHQSK